MKRVVVRRILGAMSGDEFLKMVLGSSPHMDDLLSTYSKTNEHVLR